MSLLRHIKTLNGSQDIGSLALIQQSHFAKYQKECYLKLKIRLKHYIRLIPVPPPLTKKKRQKSCKNRLSGFSILLLEQLDINFCKCFNSLVFAVANQSIDTVEMHIIVNNVPSPSPSLHPFSLLWFAPIGSVGVGVRWVEGVGVLILKGCS